MRAVAKALDRLYLFGAILSGIALCVLCLLVVYSILARLFNLYAGGATDVAGYVMATSTFLALAYTFRNKGHIRVLLMIQKAWGSARRIIEWWALGAMTAVTGYLAFYMIRLAHDSWKFGERSQGADAIPLWIPQVPVAFGATIFAIAAAHTFIESLVDPRKIDPEFITDDGGAEE
ncbi:TRAP transporter small permease [Rhodospirillum sp. A1_3_36]|uniref:TRAP transporter small permease n=1 Tax=Rhodospirillum sp. A1_3_36 TaxID=3391666 RepID=UPI0039A59651